MRLLLDAKDVRPGDRVVAVEEAPVTLDVSDVKHAPVGGGVDLMVSYPGFAYTFRLNGATPVTVERG